MIRNESCCRAAGEGCAITPEEKAWVKDLFLSHAELMFKVAAYRLHDEERAGDLVQDVFLLLIARRDQVMDYENPAGWLFETLRRSILAEAARRTRQSARELPLDEGFPLEAPPGASALGSVLPAGLREKDRELLLLYFEEGLSHKEIADQLGIAEGACWTRLCRAKERCKALMERERDAEKNF